MFLQNLPLSCIITKMITRFAVFPLSLISIFWLSEWKQVIAPFISFRSFFSWYSALEATRWLHNLSALIRSTLTIVEAIDVKSKSTLVHCSDGWDRTAQLVSLSELLLDPYYRTIKVQYIFVNEFIRVTTSLKISWII